MGRSLQYLIKTVNELISNNIDIVSLKDPINVISAQGRLMFNIFASLAKFEKDLIPERTMAGLKSARDRGLMGVDVQKDYQKKLEELHAVLKHYISRMNLHLLKLLFN
jgi:DNA invertase Pin-like site-specific DNA recombinase